LHDPKELEDFLDLIKPKKYLIENEEKSDSRKIKLEIRKIELRTLREINETHIADYFRRYH
jgi:hypothetical protein